MSHIERLLWLGFGAVVLAWSLSACVPESCVCTEMADGRTAYQDGWGRWVVECLRVECSRVVDQRPK